MQRLDFFSLFLLAFLRVFSFQFSAEEGKRRNVFSLQPPQRSPRHKTQKYEISFVCCSCLFLFFFCIWTLDSLTAWQRRCFLSLVFFFLFFILYGLDWTFSGVTVFSFSFILFCDISWVWLWCDDKGPPRESEKEVERTDRQTEWERRRRRRRRVRRVNKAGVETERLGELLF